MMVLNSVAKELPHQSYVKNCRLQLNSEPKRSSSNDKVGLKSISGTQNIGCYPCTSYAFQQRVALLLSRPVMSDSLQPHGLQPARLLCPKDFLGKSTGVGCHFLLQGIFPTQGSIPWLLWPLHCRWILYHWANWEALRVWFKGIFINIFPGYQEALQATPFCVRHLRGICFSTTISRSLE